MKTRIANATLMLTGLALSLQVMALSGDPQEHFRCDDPEPFSRFIKTQCAVDHEAYIPPTASWEYPVTIIAPQAPGAHRIKVKLSGYNARPYAFCTGYDFSSATEIVVKPCAGHFPDLDMHQVDGVKPHGWWGWYQGPSNSMRLGLSLTQASLNPNADVDAGVQIEGSSYGGTGAILQSMMLRQVDAFWGNSIAIVRADIPHTKFVANWLDYAPINVAWDGYDRAGADVEVQMANGSLANTYYRVNGSPRDTLVVFDTDFFRHCDTYRIACFGTWHDKGHNLTESGVDLPFHALYPGEHMEVRLDRMLPVFTHSTANHWGDNRGHYNLGLSWHQGDYFIDESEQVVVPIRYKAHRNIGGNIPDQPDAATFSITIRRIENFPTPVGSVVHWELHGIASGQVTVTREGEITVPALTLRDSDHYAGLRLTRPL